MQHSSFDKAIISDTSCLIALTKINKLEILRQLYKEIIITPEVVKEYNHPLPEWFIIKGEKNKALFKEMRENNFGLGESSSIALAMEIKNSVLILDDDRARNFARKKGLSVTGTLTIVGNACDLGFIDSYEEACEDLRKTNFRFSKKIQEDVKKTLDSGQSRRSSRR